MAQTGATPISLYYSATTTNVPTAGNLVAGELAINTNDGKLFYKDSSGVVQTLATKASASGSFTNLDYTGTLTGGTGVVNLGSGQFYKDASGNLGVGTSSPLSRLTISANGTTGGGEQLNITGTNTDYRLRLGFDTTANKASIQALIANVGFQDLLLNPAGGNVGIGTTNAAPSVNGKGITVFASDFPRITLRNTATGDTTADGTQLYNNGTDFILNQADGGSLQFLTNSAERMRIDSSGNLLVGQTTNPAIGKIAATFAGNTTNGIELKDSTDTAGAGYAVFRNSAGTSCGSIARSTGNTVLYNVSSDYRLKTVIAPVSDAGQRIDALQPIEYDWNTGGRTRGFLAHQFADVYPNSVSGEKDAVDAEGKPIYQGMQASTPEVMADLIAEIQSLRKRIATLEAK